MDSLRNSIALGVAWEALKLPRRNLGLFVPLILFILIPASLLYLAENFVEISIPSSDNSFARFHPSSLGSPSRAGFLKPALRAKLFKDNNVAVDIGLIFGYAYYVVYLFLTLAIVSASAKTYKREDVALRGLFFWMKREWKGPVITQLYVTVLGSGLWVFLDEVIGFSMGYWPVLCLLSVVAHVFDLYLEAVWTLGLPVSVVQGCRGLQALGMASELSRGRRLQGLAIGIVFGLGQWAISLSHRSVLSDAQLGMAAHVSLGLVFENLHWLVDIFTLVAYTIFYFECTKGQRVHGAVDGDAAYYEIRDAPADALAA